MSLGCHPVPSRIAAPNLHLLTSIVRERIHNLGIVFECLLGHLLALRRVLVDHRVLPVDLECVLEFALECVLEFALEFAPGFVLAFVLSLF